jgi:hypothetical protein
MANCRFCKESIRNDDRAVKYGTRHYAHHTCYLDAGKSLSDLHEWQIRQFPYKLLKDRGLLDCAQTLIARENVPVSRGKGI